MVDMSDATRRARLRALVEKVAGKPAPADDEESLFESGSLDSFALPDLVGAIEEEFGVKIPDADLNPRKFDSVARMDEYVAHRLKPVPPA
jgi:acyl carrier protein